MEDNNFSEITTEKKEKKQDVLLFILFSLCFLFVSFTATLSFYRFKRVFVPTPVIDIDDDSSKSSDNGNNGNGDNNTSSQDNKGNQGGNNSGNTGDNDNKQSNEGSGTNTSSEIKPNQSSEQTSSHSSSSEQSSETNPDNPIDPTGTKVIKVIYDGSTEIKPDSGILPGWVSRPKVIKVTNTSDVDLKYRVIWKFVSNNFNRPQDLVYHVSVNGHNTANGQVPTRDTVIMNNVALDAGDTHNINITIEYKNLNLDQSVDMNKLFAGVILIDTVE